MADGMLRLREAMEGFSPVERRLAQYFLEHAEELTGTPIGEVAAACHTSKSSVVRLCKRTGFKGYKDFLNALSADLAVKRHTQPVPHADIHPGSSVQEICRMVTENCIRTLTNTLHVMEMDRMERAVELLCQASVIHFFGVGNSGIVAQDAANKFRRIGIPSFFSNDAHCQVIAASTLKDGDAAVFFSYYGETRDILEALSIAKAQGARTIGVSKYGKNSLSDQVEIALQVASGETLMRASAMASRQAMLNVVDMLFTAVASAKYGDIREVLERTAQAVRHKRV